MGGKPSRGTPADQRLKANARPGASSGKAKAKPMAVSRPAKGATKK
jgi:hypothetical protein